MRYWSPKEIAREEKRRLLFSQLEQDKKHLLLLGYRVYCSLKAGDDSTYTYEYNGVGSGAGWDTPFEVVDYLKTKLNLS